MTAYLGVMDAPPEGFRRMPCLTHHSYEVWAQGSMWSAGFCWCYVERTKVVDAEVNDVLRTE